MTTLTEAAENIARTEVPAQPVRRLDELPPITDSSEPLEDQFFRVLAGIPKPVTP